LTATNSDCDGIIFKNYNDAKTYQNMGNKKENKRNIDITDIISMIGNSSFIVSKSGKDIKKLERISKNLGRLSSYASYLSTGIDLYKEINEPNVSNTIDLLIDAIGYIPGCGPYISISLSESKKALIYSSTELAKYKEYKESLLLNMISDFYFGIRIK
jgi:hypothetical protein